MISYNKAVRDKIPKIIKDSGMGCDFKKISDSEFLAELEKKIMEEIKEYEESKNVEELADILEVTYRIAALRGLDEKKLNKIRQQKAASRGKFNDNVFLIKTDD